MTSYPRARSACTRNHPRQRACVLLALPTCGPRADLLTRCAAANEVRRGLLSFTHVRTEYPTKGGRLETNQDEGVGVVCEERNWGVRPPGTTLKNIANRTSL